MDYIVKVLFVFMIFLFAWFMQEENQYWDLTRTELKKANNFATHDAAQQINQVALGDGRLIIDRTKARMEFEKTLKENLGLNDDLSPSSGSPIQGEVRIIYFEVVDDSNSTFPFLYENNTYKIAKQLRGPAVIAVIETDYFQLVNLIPYPGDMVVPAIQEYVLNK